MSTNPNTQQTNVFNKGMNTDTSDAFLGNELYRFAKNVRFFTNTGENSGELRAIEGWAEIRNNLFDGFLKRAPGSKILAISSIREYGIAIIWNTSEYKRASLAIWKHGDKEFKTFEGDVIGGENTHYNIVSLWEDDDNVKIYIASGSGEILMFRFNTKDGIQPIDTVSVIDNFVFGGIDTFRRTGGNLRPAIVQYGYILYDKYGRTSQLSPLSKPIRLYNNYPELGPMPGEMSNVSVEITVKENTSTTDFDKIKLYRITYQLINQLPTIDLIADRKLSANNFSIIDAGLTPIEADTSFAEFLSNETVNIFPTYIENKDNYLFSANFSYYRDSQYLEEYNKFNAVAQPNASLDFTKPYDKAFESFSSEDSNVSWHLCTHKTQLSSHGNDGGISVAGLLQFDKSLRRDEIYRYGIILYDANGFKWPAKWIADIRTPPCYESTPFVAKADGEDGELMPIGTGEEDGGLMPIDPNEEEFLLNNPNSGTSYGNVLGVSFKVKNLNKSIFPKYEIVRAVRTPSDSATLAQGIVGRAMYNKEDRNTYYPSGFITLGNIFTSNQLKGHNVSHNITATTENSNLLQFCCPELCYFDTFGQLLIELRYSHTIDIIGTAQLRKTSNYYISGSNQTDSESGMYWHYPITGDARIVLFSPDGLKVIEQNDSITISPSDLLQSYGSNRASAVTEEYNNTKYYRTLYNNLWAESLSYQSSIKSLSTTAISIVDPVNPALYKFSNGDTFTYNDNTFVVGTNVYVNWSVAMLSAVTSDDFDDFDKYYKEDVDFDWGNNPVGPTTKRAYLQYPIGTGGICALMNVSSTEQIPTTSASSISIANIRNNNVVPYGGVAEDSLLMSTYSSFGDYFDNDDRYHNVYDGDCFLLDFYYIALHSFDDPIHISVPKMSTVYTIPLEMSIDVASDYGDSPKRNSSHEILDVAFKYRTYAQEKDAYMYNAAFSQEPMVQTSSSIEQDDFENDTYDCRIAYSDLKQNNEKSDSWLKFRAANYIDVDTKYGPITGLKKFKNLLIFWLKDAMGVLSVNERTMLQDVNDTNIILGNGDVLQRFDYITTEYGMAPNQNAYAESDSTLYWWDEYRKEIVAYSGGQQVLPMKIAKQVSNFINEYTVVNTPALAYDPKYKELLAYVVGSAPIAYSEIAQYFTALYDILFKYSTTINGQLLLFAEKAGYIWNEGKYDNLQPSVTYVVNKDSAYVKVFDNISFGLGDKFYLFYNGSGELNLYKQKISEEKFVETDGKVKNDQQLEFIFNTPGGLESIMNPVVTDREYDFRFAIPRDQNATGKPNIWGGRMRGKTMQCEITAKNNFEKFSLQYIITKYRISWS